MELESNPKKIRFRHRAHAKRRLHERHGLEYTWELRQELIEKIRHNRSVILQRNTRNRSIRILEHKDDLYKVVYDRKTREIVTFLPIHPAETVEFKLLLLSVRWQGL